ncbi:MAG: glycosyltransferase [Chloroflexi bacterium]|nr:glycosyltransferase [Chloroflexota bacterium]
MSEKNHLPLVSIVTPSFQQAEFLERTIKSVLSQDYPNIEYMVVDGGSTDGSVEIIKKYADKLAWWVSEKDDGQSDAINKGLSRAQGEFVAWLNSDDVYLPGAIRHAASVLKDNPEVGLVYSKLHSIDQNGKVFNTISYEQYSLEDLLSFRIIGQATVFMRRSVMKKAGKIDQSYNYLLDHHLWVRMARLAEIKYEPVVWAAARHHPMAKNVAQAAEFGREAFRILDWASSEPKMAEIIKRDPKRVRAGAYRLDARYLLDGGQAWEALKAYGKVFLIQPRFALKRWYRILLALASVAGLDWLRPMIIPRRRRLGDLEPAAGVITSVGETGEVEQKVLAEKPILVTGPHRSGTTWVGKMIARGANYAYVSEPLNILHRTGIFRAPVDYWYTYICEDNEDEYLEAFKETLKLQYHTWKEVKSFRSPKDIGRMGRDWATFTRGKRGGQKALLKDPFAVFSTPWFAERLGCRVVIVVRHPAAFVNSLKRLDWPFDFRDLLEQPLLMRDCLEPFRDEMEAATQNPDDLITQGSLLWRVVYSVVDNYHQNYPEFQVVRHEDLSLYPLERFEDLYSSLGLQFTKLAQDIVLRSTQPGNPKGASRRSIYSVNLDSRANLKQWQERLSAEEINNIRNLTEDVSSLYYEDKDWI